MGGYVRIQEHGKPDKFAAPWRTSHSGINTRLIYGAPPTWLGEELGSEDVTTRGSTFSDSNSRRRDTNGHTSSHTSDGNGKAERRPSGISRKPICFICNKSDRVGKTRGIHHCYRCGVDL